MELVILHVDSLPELPEGVKTVSEHGTETIIHQAGASTGIVKHIKGDKQVISTWLNGSFVWATTNPLTGWYYITID